MRGWRLVERGGRPPDAPPAPRLPLLIPSGLRNEGNSCFFNALIQTFFHVSPVFRNAIIALVDDEGVDEADRSTSGSEQGSLRSSRQPPQPRRPHNFANASLHNSSKPTSSVPSHSFSQSPEVSSSSQLSQELLNPIMLYEPLFPETNNTGVIHRHPPLLYDHPATPSKPLQATPVRRHLSSSNERHEKRPPTPISCMQQHPLRLSQSNSTASSPHLTTISATTSSSEIFAVSYEPIHRSQNPRSFPHRHISTVQLPPRPTPIYPSPGHVIETYASTPQQQRQRTDVSRRSSRPAIQSSESSPSNHPTSSHRQLPVWSPWFSLLGGNPDLDDSAVKESNVSSQLHHQIDRPTQVLRLLKSAFIEMSIGLKSYATILGLYEAMMGDDDSQQDATEVRGMFWDIISAGVHRLPLRQRHALESVMSDSFAGALYEISKKPGETRKHPMNFFTVELTLTGDTNVESGLSELAREAHGSYSRISFDVPEVMCINLNRFSLVLDERQVESQPFPEHSRERSSVPRRSSGSIPLVAKTRCRCDFPETLCIKELQRPEDKGIIKIETLEAEMHRLTLAYQTNVASVLTAQTANWATEMKLDSLILEQERLKKVIDFKRTELENAKLEAKTVYSLMGVIVHRGSPNAGHYWAFVRQSRTDPLLWYRFDDEKVSLASFPVMYEEAAGRSQHAPNERSDETTEFKNAAAKFLPNRGVAELWNRIRYDEQLWNRDQQYVKNTAHFARCPFVSEAELSASTAASCLIYVRRPYKPEVSLSQISAAVLPSRSSVVHSDWTILTQVVSSSRLVTLMELNRFHLHALAEGFMAKAIEGLLAADHPGGYSFTSWYASPTSRQSNPGQSQKPFVAAWYLFFPCPPHALPLPFSEVLLDCLRTALIKHPRRQMVVQADALLSTNFGCLQLSS